MEENTITEEWLKETGFKWHEIERSVSKHWILWIGSAIAESKPYGRTSSYEDFGIELSRFQKETDVWGVFYRADYAGRYSRFIYCRDVWERGQLLRLIEALTDEPFDVQNVLHGCLYRPATAAHYRRQDEGRLDRWLTLKKTWRDDEQDDSKAVKK